MEREKGFEPSTLALARRCSTTELFPLPGILSEVGLNNTELTVRCQANHMRRQNLRRVPIGVTPKATMVSVRAWERSDFPRSVKDFQELF